MAKSLTRYKAYVPREAFVDAFSPGGRKASADVNAVEVDVFYSKGGLNYFSYKTEPRGYYASVMPVKVEKGDGDRFSSVAFMMMDPRGRKFLLEPAARLNGKRLKVLADKVLAVKDGLADATAAFDLERAHAIVAGAVLLGETLKVEPATVAV